ncbi:hypothetical protein ACHAXT_005245 [Thalassiosira profunda]
MSATPQQQLSAAAAAEPAQPAAGGAPSAAPAAPRAPQHQQQPQQPAEANPAAVQAAAEAPPPAQPAAPRFEDLTIDDDLPLLPRLQRYVRSSIALQRLVHVRMLGDAALEAGRQLTATELVPLLPPLVRDGEAIIRQRLCSELKVLSLVLMGMTRTTEAPPVPGSGITSLPQVPKPDKSSKYYKVMVHHLFPHLYTLISDPDNEVRRAASENIVKLALRVDKDDVVALALSIPLRLVKEGQKRASHPESSAGADPKKGGGANPTTPAEDLLITASNLLADLASFLPPPRLSPEVTAKYLSPTVLALAEDPNFRVRRAAVQALPRMLGSATLDDVKRRLLPRFVQLSGDEMYRVRKASGECLVDVSRALAVLPWRIHFSDVWIEHDAPKKKRRGGDEMDARAAPDEDRAANERIAADVANVDVAARAFYKPRTAQQLAALEETRRECHEIRRRALCAVAKQLLDDGNKFVRYGMMQFLGPLIASFYPLDRGSMTGGMGGLLFCGTKRAESGSAEGSEFGTLGIGVEGVALAKGATGLGRADVPARGGQPASLHTVDDVLSFNHSLHGLELVLHGESPTTLAILGYGGGCRADKDPFGTMGPQFFPHANGMVGRSSALDDDDTDAFLFTANYERYNEARPRADEAPVPRAALPKFALEARSDALALARIVLHRAGRVPANDENIPLPCPSLMSGQPDPEDLEAIGAALLEPFVAMASCRTGEETTDAEMRVYCAYSLPAVVLLFGEKGWENDGLRKCFLDLIGHHREPEGDDEENAGAPPPPPLPVKRCLASSVHAVARMLGPDVASSDPAFLFTFEKAFLRDPDEAIRLNVLKNLASFLGALPPGDGPGHRNGYLPVLHAIIAGEDVLGASKRRSASNPGVLNWRQRGAVARALPDWIVLFDADRAREFLWPILTALLTDAVSAVREDAGWAVPVLLRKYASGHDAAARTAEVTSWLKEAFLGGGRGADAGRGTPARRTSRRLKRQETGMAEGAFGRRQGYCRILAAVALASRMGEGEGGGPGAGFSDDGASGTRSVPIDPFGALSPYERGVFRTILLRDLLPPALEMAVDCVANVRLTLTKCLKSLPPDIQSEGRVTEVLATLEEELTTWDVGDLPLDGGMSPGGILAPGSGMAVAGAVAGLPSNATANAGGTVIMTKTMSAC